MSSHFEEMIIQGIRAYPPTTQTVIKFLHPLTIIQGNNGCGKTTIVEALNNICTGSLPQGQKQAFLHDLDNAKTKKVDALIKLRFRDARNREVVACTRMTSVAGKEGKTTTRADESTIKIYPNGGDKGIAISSKTIDFRLEMLNLLQIPKAILENVVFCHQENSTWPLSEPKVLKSKFDDIFQLTGFVKFLDKATKKHKELKDEYQKACIEHKGALAIQNEKQIAETRLATKREELEKASERQKEVQEEMTKLTNSIREATQRLQELRELTQKRNVTLAKVDGLRKQRSMLNVPEWNGEEDELKEMIREMESSREYRSATEKKAQLERKMKEFDSEGEQVKAERREAEQQMTRASAMEMHRNSTATALRDLTESFANEFGLRSDVKMQQQLEMLGEEMKSQGEGRVRILAAKEAELRASLEVATNARLSLQIELRTLMETMNKLRAEAKNIEKRLNAISSSQNEVPELRNQIATLERMLKDKAEPSSTEEENRQMDKKKRKLIETISSLRESIKNASAWEETGRNRERMQKEKESEERARESLLSKHEADFMLLFNRVIRLEPINAKISHIYGEAQRSLATHREILKNAEIAHDRALNMVKQKRDERDSLFNEKMELQEKIVQVTGDPEIDPDDVDWRHEQTMASVQSFRKELAPLEASATLYSKWAEETRQKKCCPLCERGFGRGDSAGVSKLADKLADMSLRIPQESAELSARLEEEEQDERKLAQAKNYAEQIRTATRKWNELKTEVKAAEKEVEVCKTRLEKERGNLELMTKRAEAVNRIKADASLMDSHMKAAEKLGTQLEEGESEWHKIGAPAVQQKQKEEESLKKAEDELEMMNRRVDETQKKTAEINRITKEMNELRDRILRLDEDVVQRAAIEERLQKCYDELRTCEGRAREIEIEGPKRDREVESARLLLHSAERETRAAESEAAATMHKIMERRDRLARMSEEVDKFTRSMINMDALRASLARCDEKLDQLRTRKAECEHEVTRVGEAQDKRRFLSDQLALIENKRELAKYEKQLEELSGTEEEQRQIDGSLQKMERKRSDLLRSQGELEGQQKAVKDEVDELRSRLNSAGMKAADEHFIECLVNKKVYGDAIDDLQQYMDAVDKNMMDFHQLKMEKINRIVEDLWSACYKGGDIENIHIQSEQASEVGESKRKSYNYRVLMELTSGATVDMRDRCSAGQKMLACLIIRLALADTFGSSCATIALDEPTTNLDKDKVDSMAEMLGRLIAVRSSKDHLEGGGKGIQMLVITHDRRFVDKLCLDVKPEFRYEVTKEGPNAHSTIQRVYINGTHELAQASQLMQDDEWMGRARQAPTRTTRGKRKATVDDDDEY